MKTNIRPTEACDNADKVIKFYNDLRKLGLEDRELHIASRDLLCDLLHWIHERSKDSEYMSVEGEVEKAISIVQKELKDSEGDKK